jgi:hypothetical protein
MERGIKGEGAKTYRDDGLRTVRSKILGLAWLPISSKSPKPCRVELLLIHSFSHALGNF